MVARNTGRVEQELAQIRSDRKASRTLARLETHIENGQISQIEALDSASRKMTEEEILVAARALSYARNIDEPLIATFGLAIEDVLRYRDDIPEKTTASIWSLCDFLELEFVQYLKDTTTFKYYYSEESFRDGEDLSIRLVFPDLTLKTSDRLCLQPFGLPCWRILELSHFHAIYGEHYSQLIDGDLAILQAYFQPRIQ